MKYLLNLLFIIFLLFSQINFGEAYAASTEPTSFTMALLGAGLGAVAGGVVWYVVNVEEDDDERDVEKNRKELKNYVLVGSAIGLVTGLSSVSESNKYSMINIESKYNSNRFYIKFPRILFDPFRNKIGVNIVQFRFK